MPIYEYKCDECSHVFEKLQKRDAAPPDTCPECGSKQNIHRIVSNTSFHLKGSGWYVTDYGKSTGSSEGDSSSSAADTETSSAPATAGAGDDTAA